MTTKKQQKLNNELIDEAKNGHTDTVELLLDKGADIHVKEDYALRRAARNGHTETVKLLLDRGADSHAMEDYALRRAVANGHTDTAELLLDRGADIRAKEDHALRVEAWHSLNLKDGETFRKLHIQKEKTTMTDSTPNITALLTTASFWKTYLNRSDITAEDVKDMLDLYGLALRKVELEKD